MRAREFITEQRELPPEISDPLRYTYILPGLSAADPYRNYRFGVAVARARSNLGKDQLTLEALAAENAQLRRLAEARERLPRARINSRWTRKLLHGNQKLRLANTA